MSWISWLSPGRPQSGEAVAFVRSLAFEAVLPVAVIAVRGKGRAETAAIDPHGRDLTAWIAKRAKQHLYMLTAVTGGPVTGGAISENDLTATRIVSVFAPAAKADALAQFHPRPAIIVATPKGITAAWRLRNPTAPAKALTIAGQIAEKVGGNPAGHLFPVPGCGGVRLLQHLKGPQHWALVTAFDAALGNGADPETDASEALFVRADAVEMEQIRWLWPGVLPIGALSLIAGEAGVGKSTLAACIAAIVSAGGIWPTGERAERGGVIFCEGEDPRDTVTAPRLAAAGADMRRVILGPVCDLSASVDQLRAAAAQLPGGAKLVVLSPIRSFFGLESYRSGDVRARLAPLLAWAETDGLAVLGVSHPKTGQRDFAGASAWKEVARAGLFAERTEDDGRHVTPLKANQARDDWTRPYRIEEARANGIIASRVVFLPPRGEAKGEDEGHAPSTAKRTIGAAAVQSWLEEQLADGPCNSGKLKAAAAKAGITPSPLYRAAVSLGVRRESIDGTLRKMWELP